MSINFKPATFALGVSCLFVAGHANAACDGRIRNSHNNVTVQCYYMPTMSNGHYVGMQKQVNYGTYNNEPRGGHYPGATIGTPVGTNSPHVVYPPHRAK